MILGISAASAADIDDTSDSDVLSVEETTVDEVVSTDAVDEVQTASEDTEVLTDDGDASNFTALQYRIDSSNTICYIMNDYKKAEGDDVVTISKDISIIARGGTFTIDANNNGGIFKINPGVSVYLSGVTLVNGNSDYGAAIYNEGDLVLDGCTFSNNVATQNGGAIYNTATLDINDCILSDNIATYRGGAIYNEGTLTVTGSTIDSNDITFRAKNDDNGGAAIYNNGGTINLDDVEVTNNLKDIVIRDGNDGHLINAAIFTNGDATIVNSYIANNTGSWGAGVYVTNGATLTVSNTVFEGNNATFGAGIYDEGAVLNVDNCTFNDNLAIGVGSAGTSSTQAGAILVMAQGASATITNSRFNRNSAKTGGAVSISQATGSVLIDDCEFTENTASYEGGAIYNYIANGAALTVTDSTFTDNTATNWGNAISNDGDLSLSGNTISGDGAEIGNWLGEVDTQYQITILDGQSHELTVPTYQLTAIVTDDNGNKINDHNFIFLVGDEEVQGTYYTSEGMYIADYTFTAPGTYVITTDYENAEIINSSVTFIAALSSLKNIVDTAIANGETSVDLSYGFQYYEPIDGVDYHGIVISEDFTINGNGLAIDGGNAARLFNVTNDATLTLNNVILTNGKADKAAAVYVDNGAKLDATDVTFSSNVALDNGGAIYTDGGEITLTNCVLDANDVTNLETSASQNMGGAAIYAKNAQVTLVNTNVTNNGRSELDRSNGDLINAVINLINSDATITGGLFENNTGIYGGAIYAEGDGTQTLTVTGATFNNNKAYNGGAIDIDHGMITSISDSAFNNNLVVGPGSSGYYGAGGAIAVGGTGSFSLTDSNFTANQATGEGATGGAVHVGLAVKDAASISGCEFTDNSATDRGSAIFNHGYVSLSDNVIDDELGIYSNGEIDSQVFVIFMDNEAKTFDAFDDVNAYAKVVDDNGNIIKVDSITLVTTGFAQGFGGTLFAFNETDNLYHAKLVPTKTGIGASVSNPLKKLFSTVTVLSQTITVNPVDRILEVTYENISEGNPLTVNVKLTRAKDGALLSYTTVTIIIGNVTKSVSTRSGVGSVTFDNLTFGSYVINASVKGSASYNPIEQLYNLTVSPVKGTFTDLQYIIDNDEIGLVFLPYDFKYDPDYDANLTNGVVINKNLYIIGNDYTIDANNSARIFNVTNGAVFKIDDATLTNGLADYGGAIYVDADSFLNTQNVVLYNNTATYRGGAIYSEGTVDVMDSVLDSNDITFRTKNDDNGGAAIYNLKGDLSISNSNITNNLKDIVIRDGNAGDLLVGVVVTSGYTFIEDSYFANNTGSWGGAISSLGYMNDESYLLSIKNSKFEGNNATFGGAIFVESSELVVDNCTFENNKGVGVGSSGTSNTQGGAIVVFPEGASATITDSTFTDNSANLGGAVSLPGIDSNSIIDNCTFTDNTAAANGGAVYYWSNTADLEITDSTFTGNSAPDGGAVYFCGYSDLTVTGSEFTDNTADYGGAIENEGFGALTVDDSKFTENAATVSGGAIISSGNTSVSNSEFADNEAGVTNTNAIYMWADNNTLALSNNVITGSDDAQILVKAGTSVISPLKVVILDNGTYNIHMSPYNITAVVTDMDDNLIIDNSFRFIVGDTVVEDIEINATTGVYTATFTPTEVGTFVVSTNLEDASEIQTATLNVYRTFTDLANIIANAEAGDTIVLDGDYAYNPEFDSALIAGIVIDKAITIDGNGYTINGSDAARILQLNANGITIDNVTFTNGYADMDSTSSADWGGAIYSNGAYTNHIISNSRFYNNTAYNGGAIYLAGDDSKIINSTFEDNTANASGGAVFLFGWDCTIEGSNFTDNTANQLGGAVAMYSSHPAIIRESSFISNYAGQNGGAVSWQRATGSIFDSTFIENEAGANGGAVFWDANSGSVAGGEFTGNIANGFGGAIFVNDNAGLTVASTFTENAALNGGAIAAYGDTTVYSSTFTENTADNYGGAIFVNDGAELDIKQSTIKDNTATVGNSIYVMDGTVDSSIINATILDNKTWDDTDLGDIYILNATLTDDNGNMIYDPSFRFTVDGTVIEDVPLYDDETGLYTIPYYIGTAGSKVVSTNYDAENLEIFTGILDIPKANITEFTVLTIDALEGENASIWINLIGVNDKGLNSTVTVIVNNKEYAVPVENGEGNLTIEGLTHGQYPVVAMFDDPSYNPAINSSVFFVKGKSVLNITELTVAEYGDVIEIAINLTGSDGKPLTGVVVVDDVINVLVENGIGTFVIDNQPDVGNYTFQAVYDGDNDYFGDLAVFNVTVNTKVIDPEDIVVEIPNINEFGEAIPITITSPVDGTYTVNINGTPVEVEVVNGVGNATITLDKPGIYNATVDIADEGYSLETITTDEFEYLVTPEFNVEITGTYPEAEISITGPAGTYHIIIDGMEPVDITRGESGLPTLVTLLDMDAGNYTALVSFDARDEYYGDYKEINFTVNKAALDIEEPEVIGDKVIESPINITFTLPADVDPSTVTAFMDGVSVPIDEFVINETTGVYTLPLDGFSDAVGHLFTVEVNDPNYEEDGAQVTFTIEKVETTVTIKVDESEIGVMGSPIVNITVSNNASGYIVIDNNGAVSAVEIVNGTYSYQITDLTAGEYYINVTFLGNEKYLKSNATKEFNVPKSVATPEIIDVTSSILGGQDATFKVDMNNDFATGNVTIYVDDKEYATVILDDDYANATVVIKGLTSGPHSIGVKYNGNDNFEESDVVPVDITVTKADSKVTIDPIDALFELPITITYNIENETEITVSIKDENGTEISETFTVEDGKIIVRPLDVGKYTIVIENIGNDMFNGNSASQDFNVVENPNFSYDVGLPDNTTTDTTFTINVPKDATGYLLVDIDGKHYYAPVENGTASVTVSGLAPGNYTANITYTGDDRYPGITTTDDVSVPSNVPENALTIPETSETTSPTYSINLPSDATGYLVVDVDGTKYAAALVNGSASVTVPGLAEGNHNVTVTYTGDGKYSSVSKNTTLNVHVPVYNITNNKNIKMLYTAKSPYKVLVTKDGKAVGAGEVVTFKFNGKTYKVKTDANGYATLKIPNVKPKKATYPITATYKGVTVKNTVKVNNIIKAKNKKVKKSKKVTKVKVSLKKVNKKYLKKKTLKVKFRGKIYKVKTNKKGVATWKVKKSMLKKLKVGKKYKYKVTYGKNTLTKKLTIKR